MQDTITKPLLKWYGENKRVLPWREKKNPYEIWVSEIMLQQTRVEAVKPFYTETVPPAGVNLMALDSRFSST